MGQLGTQSVDHVLVTSARLHKSFSSTGTQQAVPRKEVVSRTVGSLQPRAPLGLCLLPKRTCHLVLTNHPPFLPHLPAQATSQAVASWMAGRSRAAPRAKVCKDSSGTLSSLVGSLLP